MQSATRTTAATAATATATTAASRPPVSPLITALRNAFKHLSNHQFEEECLIERQRRASLKKKKPPALNNSDTINSRKRPAAVVPHGASTLDDDDDDDSNNNDANTANRSSSSSKKKRKKTTNALSRVTLPLAQPNNADDVPQMAAQAAAADATAKKPHGNCRNWEDRYIELVNYKKEHSTFLNIHQKRPDGRGHGLALWVEMQRYGYENRHHMLETGEIKHNGKTIMTQEQENRLTSIGFDFLFPRQRAFETRFTQISAYKAEHGHTRVPKAFKGQVMNGLGSLGQWVATIKKQYHAGRTPPEFVKRLDAIGFDWSHRQQKKKK